MVQLHMFLEKFLSICDFVKTYMYNSRRIQFYPRVILSEKGNLFVGQYEPEQVRVRAALHAVALSQLWPKGLATWKAPRKERTSITLPLSCNPLVFVICFLGTFSSCHTVALCYQQCLIYLNYLRIYVLLQNHVICKYLILS